MQQWRFGRGMYRLIAVLMVTTALIMSGCSGDDDEAQVVDDPAQQARTLAGKTIQFDAGFIDPALAGLQAVLEFGAATDDNTVSFTLTIGGTTSLEGTATFASIDLLFESIFVNDVVEADGVVTINGVIFQTGPNGVLRFDIEIIIEPDGTVTITLINSRGEELVAVFEPGQTGTTGTTGSPGGPGGVQP